MAQTQIIGYDSNSVKTPRDMRDGINVYFVKTQSGSLIVGHMENLKVGYTVGEAGDGGEDFYLGFTDQGTSKRMGIPVQSRVLTMEEYERLRDKEQVRCGASANGDIHYFPATLSELTSTITLDSGNEFPAIYVDASIGNQFRIAAPGDRPNAELVEWTGPPVVIGGHTFQWILATTQKMEKGMTWKVAALGVEDDVEGPSDAASESSEEPAKKRQRGPGKKKSESAPVTRNALDTLSNKEVMATMMQAIDSFNVQVEHSNLAQARVLSLLEEQLLLSAEMRDLLRVLVVKATEPEATQVFTTVADLEDGYEHKDDK